MNNFSKLLLLSIFCLSITLASQADYMRDIHRCNNIDIANKAKDLLESKGEFLRFCSNCDYMLAPIQRIKINKIEIVQEGCANEIKIVDGYVKEYIASPVFEGYCSDTLEVSNPIVKAGRKFIFKEQKIDLSYVYLWNEKEQKYTTVAEYLGLDMDAICTHSIKLTRDQVLKQYKKSKKK